jgi:DNA (cytosine-5)-methyltransferase 1
LRELALFAGAGGGILGGKLLGWQTVCAVENEPYARDVLLARQNDGCLEAFPIWDDVRTFDGRPWRGIVDVVSGGFPCQDISAAGKGAGIEGERSGLWTEFARIIGEVQPSFVFVENSPMLASRGLGTVLGDLAAMGFDAEWGVLGAHHSGAPHKRDRIWILARDSDCDSEPTQSVHDEAPRVPGLDVSDTHTDACSPSWWKSEPNVGRVAHGLAARVDRLRCIGNGQVPAVAALAWETLIERFNDAAL